ncbi:hypothetical protein RQP46_003125 [Phenoliferia psychrophenolica]
MATINSLANETLCMIMGMIKVPSRPLRDIARSYLPDSYYDSLRAAALVCSRWRDPAQRALFDSIILDTTIISRNKKLLTSPARSRYRTRSMEIKGRATGGWLDVAKGSQGLEELILRVDGYTSTLRWELLAHPCLAGLKYLGISCPDVFEVQAGSVPIFTMRLKTLALCLVERGGAANASPAFIAALFAASSESLQTLYLKIPSPRAEYLLHSGFHHIAENLKTLTVESGHNPFAGHHDLFSACTSLESLSFQIYRSFHLDYWNSDSTLNLQALLDALPSNPTLRHLRLLLYKPLDLVLIVTLLEHPALERLHELDFPHLGLYRRSLDAEEVVKSALLAMKETCEFRGIECRGSSERFLWEEKELTWNKE